MLVRRRCSAAVTAFASLLLLFGLGGCEAQLRLDAVEAERQKQIHRYDMFQSAASQGGTTVLVSSVGSLVSSDDDGATWSRTDLPGRPPLISVTACEDGDFFALDSLRGIWRRAADQSQWLSSRLDTPESTLSIHCAPGGRLWVSASFATLYYSDDKGANWSEFSLYDDLQFTGVRFIDASVGYAVGEFGAVVKTLDGGESWEQLASIPNEFYPMAVDFLDAQTGWIGGLDGVVWSTADGGQSWQRQVSVSPSPVYGIHASARGVYAIGGSAKLVRHEQDIWREFDGAPEVQTYLRAIAEIAPGLLVVAGGGGTVALVDEAAGERG